MSAAKWFDTSAELQKLRLPPAKVAKPAKVDEQDTENFSNFSRFSRGVCPETHFSPPPNEEDTANFSNFSHFSRGIGPNTHFSPSEAQGFPDDARAPDLDTWLCPHCGQEATIDDVFPSLDGERTLTLWRCDPCQVVAVTPDAIQQPPTAWIRRVQQ